MKVERLHIRQFRNIEEADLIPSPEINLLYGENAQGKTNLLEALWLFTGGRSFRGVKDAELPRFGEAKAVLQGEFFTDDRHQQVTITVDRRRKAIVNGVEMPAMSRMVGRFPAVVFFPDHLTLIKAGPDGRRRFMDAALCQLRPAYIQSVAAYNRVLTQRNALLRQWHARPSEELLAALTDKLAEYGQQIVKNRLDYTNRLQETAVERYNGLSGGQEQLSLAYEPTRHYDELSDADCRVRLREEWDAHRKADVEAGFTTVGPHREDLYVRIDGRSARLYGSQGQQRSAVLALKLAEAAILRETTGKRPAVLLDDVMSELDASRQAYIVSQLAGWQVFITCCDPTTIWSSVEGKRFHVKHGTLTEEG